MQKQLVPSARYLELLNEEIRRHPFYKDGMQFTESPAAYTAPTLLNITWDKEKWAKFDFVFAAAARVVRSRYQTK